MGLPTYLRDVIIGVDFTDLSVTRHHEQLYGTAQVEYRSMQWAGIDSAEDWSYAIDALARATEQEFGIEHTDWRFASVDGRWARFEAI